MGQLFENLRLIIEDFKTSWYFRLWCAFWFICALVAFIGLIELSALSTESGKEKDWNTWIENATELEFPSFRLRFSHFDTSDETIVGLINCTQGRSNLITPRYCPGHTNFSKCFFVDTSNIILKNEWGRFGEERITCNFNTIGWNTTENQNIGWEFHSPVGHLGPSRYYSTLYLAPRSRPGAWVMLNKAYISPLSGDSEITGSNSRSIPIWEKKFVYHSTLSTPGVYSITTMVSSFRVMHYEQTDTFNGWMAIGAIGGFAFWMVILHTICMIVIGIFFSNESKFLTNHNAGSVERRPIM